MATEPRMKSGLDPLTLNAPTSLSRAAQHQMVLNHEINPVSVLRCTAPETLTLTGLCTKIDFG
jgi:hypothetical protein